MAVKTFGFIEKLGFEDRFRRPGQHPQRILPVEQQRPDAVFGRTAVGDPVVERQPSRLGQNRRRAAPPIFSSQVPSRPVMSSSLGLSSQASRSSENFSQIEGYFTP